MSQSLEIQAGHITARVMESAAQEQSHAASN